MLFAFTSLKNRFASALAVLLLGLFALPAFADVWGYIDAKGVAHFSTEKLDERYELFFKGGESFSTEKSDKLVPLAQGKNAAGGYQIPAGSAHAPTKLLAYFDVSPNYKAVKHLLKDASQTHGIDYELLQALIATESGFDTHAVSPKGAVGLMQLMPETARDMQVANVMHPEETRVAIVHDGRLMELNIEISGKEQIKGKKNNVSENNSIFWSFLKKKKRKITLN